MGSAPLLTAALIVKDEADHLRRCLSSIRDVVDEIVVVDTGSVDDSVAVAKEHGATVLHRPWDARFSPPRNLGLDSATGRWILYIDADEELEVRDPDEFRRGLEAGERGGVIAYRVPFIAVTGTTPYLEWRIWQHRPELRFRGTMHEGITESIAELVGEHPDLHLERCDSVLIRHYGYDGDQSAKHRRNLPLLQAELQRTPERTYLWDHLGRVLRALESRESAEAAWRQAIEVVRQRGPRDATDGMAYADLISSRLLAGDDVEDLLTEALGLFPTNWFLHWVASVNAFEHAEYPRVLHHSGLLLACGSEEIIASGLSYDERIFGPMSAHLRGMAAFHLGDDDEALRCFTSARDAAPEVLDYRIKATLAASRIAARRATPDTP